MFLYGGWLSRLGDFIIRGFTLGFLWIIGSLPIITIGASTTAAYYVGIKLFKNENLNIFKAYYQSFKQNFLQSSLLAIPYLIALIGGLYFYVNLDYFQQLGRSIISLYLITSIFLLMLLMNCFPLLCKFELKTLQFLKLSIVFCYAYPIAMIKIVIMFILTCYISLSYPLFGILAVGSYFLISSRWYEKIFIKIINKSKEANDNQVLN